MYLCSQASSPPVGILEADDVVLTQIAARLYLDDLEGQLARVGQPMHVAQRDVGRFVLTQQEGLLAVGDFGGALHDDPVLGPVVVHLQAEARAGIDDDALHLEARAGVDGVVPAPRAVDLAVGRGLAALFELECGDDLLDVLGLVLAGDEHGVGRFDDHRVVQTHAGDHAVLGIDEGVAAVFEEHVAPGDVAAAVLVGDVPERIPGAHVGPAGAHGHDAARNAQIGGAGEFLHHRVVDGIRRAGHEGILIHPHEVRVPRPALPGGVAGLGHGGLQRREGFEPGAGAHHEEAAVPKVFAAIEIALGGGGVGLFDEGSDGLAAVGALGAEADVAVAGLGAVGDDAEGDDGAVQRSRNARVDGGLEAGEVTDHVVRRHHQQHGVGFRHGERRQGQGRRGIAADGFEHDVAAAAAHRAQLLGGDEAVFLVAHDDRRLGDRQTPLEAGKPPGRGLQHRLVAHQGQQLLRVLFAGKRPQAGAGATGENDGLEFHGDYL